MRKLRMLLIEDDADDVQLLQEALSDSQVPCELRVIMEGDKVLPYLHNAEHLPDVIVMDLNLPKMHGREILVRIRSLPAFANIPLVVLSTSASPYDIQFAYDNGADKFITKPSTISGFNSAVDTIVLMTVIE